MTLTPSSEIADQAIMDIIVGQLRGLFGRHILHYNTLSIFSSVIHIILLINMPTENDVNDLVEDLVGKAIEYLGANSHPRDCNQYPEIAIRWDRREEKRRGINNILYETVKTVVHFAKHRKRLVLLDIARMGSSVPCDARNSIWVFPNHQHFRQR